MLQFKICWKYYPNWFWFSYPNFQNYLHLSIDLRNTKLKLLIINDFSRKMFKYQKVFESKFNPWIQKLGSFKSKPFLTLLRNPNPIYDTNNQKNLKLNTWNDSFGILHENAKKTIFFHFYGFPWFPRPFFQVSTLQKDGISPPRFLPAVATVAEKETPNKQIFCS